jgi:transketolase
MSETFDDLDRLCVNTIRTLAIDMVENADSGHPGLPLGAAPMGYVLWQRHLDHDPRDPLWPDRDRFVLSAGHGSALLYSLLHLTGYDLSIDDLKGFRQWGSRTPGHPERGHTPGVEVTTGPLGQGFANAVGMAIAERHLANRFNRPGHDIVDHRTFALVSDGDLMEGIASEAASLAGHLGLGKLVFLYDSNNVSLDGATRITFTEDVGKRFESYGWQVLVVTKGDTDLQAIDEAIATAKAETARPSLIIVHTTIGYGSPHKHGTSKAHGSPLGDEEVALTKKALGWEHPERTFWIPDDALARFRDAVDNGQRLHDAWRIRFEAYEVAYPELAVEWRRTMAGEFPGDWDRGLPSWKPGDKVATRAAGGLALNAIAARVPWILGGDADLSTSTDTRLRDGGDFDAATGAGRNLHFGVREHAMAGIANGMACHGGVRPYVATFFCFSDYMRPAVRLAALSRAPVVFVWTHDSIGLGEDGPTHQPVEHLTSLRAIPDLWVVRPADADEAAQAWRVALERRDGPVGLVLTRQKLPVLDRRRLAPATGLARGAYVLADPPEGEPEALVIATGSEVHVALAARGRLESGGVRTRVVSMPCWELFEAQDAAYRESVLPARITARVSIEAGATLAWPKWIGIQGIAIGVDRFGASAPGDVVLRELGITPEHVVEAVRRLLKRPAMRAA